MKEGKNYAGNAGKGAVGDWVVTFQQGPSLEAFETPN